MCKSIGSEEIKSKGNEREGMRKEEKVFLNQMVIVRVETFVDDETCTFVLSCLVHITLLFV